MVLTPVEEVVLTSWKIKIVIAVCLSPGVEFAKTVT